MSKIQEQKNSQICTKKKIQEPTKYSVILLNDEVTTMDFVIEILISIFHKNLETSQALMLKIHKTGQGVCGIYPYDIADTKVSQVHELAKMNNFPLKCITEKI